MAELQTWPDES